MPRYAPDAALLSPEASGLGEPALTAQADVAEDLLGLAGTQYEGEDAARLSRAVALQVNHQVAIGAEGTALSMSVRGSRTQVFRGTGGAPPMVSAAAAKIVAQVMATGGGTPAADAWGTVTSLRGRNLS